MLTRHAHPELWEVIPHYLRGRGCLLMVDVCNCVSLRMQKATAAQDKMGWRHFTKGKFARMPLMVQGSYLLSVNTRLTVEDQAKSLVEELMTLSCSRWIYYNVSRHHITRGLTQ